MASLKKADDAIEGFVGKYSAPFGAFATAVLVSFVATPLIGVPVGLLHYILLSKGGWER